MEQHDNGTRKDLVKYRIRSAKEDLKSAQILLEAGSLKAANNRAYYAILGEFQKQRKSGMPVIMTTFTSQPLMRQKGR